MKSLALLLGLTLALSGAAQSPKKGSEGEIPAVLKEAQEKSKKLRFSGVRHVSFFRAGKVESHDEFVTKDGSKMRIEFSGDSRFAGQIIIETPDARKHFYPDRNELKESPSFGRRQFEGFRGGMRGKTPKISDGGIVAGIKTTRVQFSDPMNNPMIEVFVDLASGLTLKRVIYGPGGNVAGSFEFKSVNLKPKISKDAFVFIRKGVKIVRPIDELLAKAKEAGLPMVGFLKSDALKLEGVGARDVRGKKVLALNYANATSRVTLFIMKPDVDPAELGKMARRQQGFYAWKNYGATLMLVGDESKETMQVLSKRITDQIR